MSMKLTRYYAEGGHGGVLCLSEDTGPVEAPELEEMGSDITRGWSTDGAQVYLAADVQALFTQADVDHIRGMGLFLLDEKLQSLADRIESLLGEKTE